MSSTNVWGLVWAFLTHCRLEMVCFCIVFEFVLWCFLRALWCIHHKVAAVYYSEWTSLEPSSRWPVCHTHHISELWWLISPTRGQYCCESYYHSKLQAILTKTFSVFKVVAIVWVVLYVKNVSDMIVTVTLEMDGESVGYHAHTLVWPGRPRWGKRAVYLQTLLH